MFSVDPNLSGPSHRTKNEAECLEKNSVRLGMQIAFGRVRRKTAPIGLGG